MNVAEKLAREIRRVSELRRQYEEIGRRPNVIVGPAMMLMEAALEQACKAAGVDDAQTQMAALQDLHLSPFVRIHHPRVRRRPTGELTWL